MGLKSWMVITILINYQVLEAQMFMGNVVDQNLQSLVGATVHWLESNTGTSTNDNGFFKLERKPGDHHLIISYTGFSKDTFVVDSEKSFEVFTLREGVILQTVDVQTNRNTNVFSRLEPHNVEKLEKGEFRKAACCSLAESFQTSNAVDISYTNAATGSKEIQFLGLRGIYMDLLMENRQSFSGIIAPFAFDYIPGTWMDRVDIQKGASSVVNGVQSMSGAINVQLKKPYEDVPLFLNLFGDLHGRVESNVHLNKRWNEARSSGLYLNTAFQQKNKDHNHDGFQDEAKTKRVNALIRNILFGQTLEGQINGQIIYEKKDAGQINVDAPYRIQQEIQHLDLNGNLGYVGFEDPENSLGSIYNFEHSTIDATYGNKNYHGKESNAHLTLLMKLALRDKRHQFTAGPKLHWSDATETLEGQSIEYVQKVGSLSAEHSFRNDLTVDNALTTTLGIQSDWIAGHKPIWSPRASLRYLFAKDWTFRTSIGHGFRFPRLFAENLTYLASSKSWSVDTKPLIEKSWNLGFNVVGKPYAWGKEFQINLDVYYTWFTDQMVIDLDQNDQQVNIYALDGKSRALQSILTLSYQPFSFLQFKFGGKFTDTKIEYQKGFRQALMVPKYRGLVSVDLETANKMWLLNATSNYVGEMRLSDKEGVPVSILHDHTSRSKPYWLLQTQLTHVRPLIELYVGAENILNYTQHGAIIDHGNPQSAYFNASEIYAPISGVKFYFGIKWKLHRAE